MAVTYTIQPRATWGDGVPVTTKDVLFTWEVGGLPQSGVGNAELHRRIWKVDLVDDKTFVLHDEKLDFQYNAINDFRVLPEHLERNIFEADPATYRNRTLFDADPTNPGLAFGPYRIIKIVPGSSVALEQNATWWGDGPAFGRIVVKAIESTARRSRPTCSPGDVDMTDGTLGLSIDQAIAFAKRHARPLPRRLQARPLLRACRPHDWKPDPRRPAGRGRRCSTGPIGRRSASGSSTAASRSPIPSSIRWTGCIPRMSSTIPMIRQGRCPARRGGLAQGGRAA